MTKAPRSTSVRKGRSRTDVERVHHVLKVTAWGYDYSLRSSDPKSRWDGMAYSELATLDFAGELIRTERSKYALGKVTLSARQGILEEPLTAAARCLGNLSGRGDVLEAYIFVPVERMSELVLVAQAGRIQFISFVASKLRYGSGAVYGVALHSEADEEWQ